jgi:hypothetical protein
VNKCFLPVLLLISHNKRPVWILKLAKGDRFVYSVVLFDMNVVMHFSYT